MKRIIIQLAILIRKGVNQLLFQYDRFLNKKTNIFILSYHGFSNDPWFFNTRLIELEKQIVYLQKSGYQWLALNDLPTYLQEKDQKPAVIFTIDDGYTDVLQTVAIFKKYNITPTLFVLGDAVHANRKEMGNNKPLLSFRQIRDLQQLGWDIGSHTATHSNLLTLTKEEVFDEIVTSKKVIEKSLGKKIVSLAYPRGKYSDKTHLQIILDTVKNAGYTFALTMDDGFISEETSLLQLPRIGINYSHNLQEFKTLFSPSVIRFRQFIKNSFLEKYL